MRLFAIKLFLFFVINIVCASVFVIISQSRYTYTNGDSEAHFYIIPKNRQYDLVFLGSSHGRVFSSTQNHARVENILSKKIINFSKTAAGPLSEKWYLSYFYERGNDVPQIIYFIDPFVFFADRWNEHDYFLEDEPLRFDFLILAIRERLSAGQFFNYVRSKFTPFWITGYAPSRLSEQDHALSVIDPQAIEKRFSILYPKGANEQEFERYGKQLAEIVRMSSEHHAKMTFVFAPTLLGDIPGKKETLDALHLLQKQYSFSVFDFSNSVRDTALFNDHDHLNTKGVIFFTENYLKKIL